jgi:hypothetical protein
MEMNFSSASGAEFLSGWYFRDSLRYAFLISDSPALFETTVIDLA